MSTKQVIVMRKDLNMRKGKMVAQGSHASLGVLLKLMRGGIEHSEYTAPEESYELVLKVPNETPLHDWISNQFTKVCLGVNSYEELISIYEGAVKASLPVALIKDKGHTEFHGVETATCLAIGPAYSSEIDKITGSLGLL